MLKGAVVPKYQMSISEFDFASRNIGREYKPDIKKRGKFNIDMNIELNDINREEYNQNIQKKKAYYYKKDGNTVAYGYKNMCPLEIIICNENHKGFYLEIQNDEIFNIWIEIEGVIFKLCTYSRWDTLEKLNKNLSYMGKEEFLKTLEDLEQNHEYIKQLYITVLKALGYIDLAEHYTEYMCMIKHEMEVERQKRELEEKIKHEEEEKKQQEEFDIQLFEAENSILKKNKVENVKTNKGGSLFLELFKANGIKLPLRTQGWVNDILAEVTFKFDGSITYCYFSRGSDSKVFRDYLCRLEQRILEKHGICNGQNKSV